MSVWHTILVFILAEPRGLSSGERRHSLLSVLVTHSAWSHLILACVWLGNPTSKHISGCVFVRCSLLPSGQLFSKTDAAFNLRLINRACSSCLSRRAHGAVCPSQTTIELCSSHHSEVYPKHLKTEVCTSVPSCTFLIIPINVPRVCSTGSQDFWKGELVHRWQVPLWFLPQWNDGWWLTAISGLGNITDNPDQFFPPAGAEWGTFSQDRRRALIGSRPVIVIMCASHRSLLWLGEPWLNLHLIRLLHRGWHSSWWEGLRSTLPPLDSMDGLAPDTGSGLVSDWDPPPATTTHRTSLQRSLI